MDSMEKQGVYDRDDSLGTSDNPEHTQHLSETCRPTSLCSEDTLQKLRNAGVESFATPSSLQESGTPVTPDANKTDSGSVKKKKKKKRSNLRIFYGTFVHSTAQEPLIILDKWLIGVEKGKILFSEAAESYSALVDLYKLEDIKKDITICLAEGTFMMPGFVDAHTDASSFLTAGLQETDRKLQQKYSLIHDDRIATNVFTKVIDRTQQLGTTTIAFNGSHVESAARLLSNILVRTKQRTSVGISLSTPDNREDLHFVQLTKCQDVIQHVQRKKDSHNGSIRAELLINSSLPDWLEDKVAAIQIDTGVTVKVSINDFPGNSENDGDDEKPITPLQYHAKHGLINDRTIAIHGPACRSADLTLLKDNGAGLVYCPSADIKQNNYSNLRELVASGVPVGLGSDLSNSGSLSMLTAIRQCEVVNNHQSVTPTQEPVCTKCARHKQNGIHENVDSSRPVNYKDFFKMATLGGAQVLGLSDVVGNFDVGKDFDAILVDTNVPDCPFFAVPSKDTAEDFLQRFLFCGDDRNITAVYISGQRVK